MRAGLTRLRRKANRNTLQILRHLSRERGASIAPLWIMFRVWAWSETLQLAAVPGLRKAANLPQLDCPRLSLVYIG